LTAERGVSAKGFERGNDGFKNAEPTRETERKRTRRPNRIVIVKTTALEKAEALSDQSAPGPAASAGSGGHNPSHGMPYNFERAKTRALYRD
jgi:hypothetical protein